MKYRKEIKMDCLGEFRRIKAALFHLENVFEVDIEKVQKELWSLWPECLRIAEEEED